jgi:TRAP-type C4-dicarboxylate transport system permease small subunit
MTEMNEKTKAAVVAMEFIGATYVQRSAAHVYFDIPTSWTKSKCDKAAKEFIRQTGIGVRFRIK